MVAAAEQHLRPAECDVPATEPRVVWTAAATEASVAPTA